MRRVVIGIIRGYQYLISPMIGPHCRFHPSCSQYVLKAIEQHGIGRGIWLATRRVAKCHPWNPGGDDPVPPKMTSTKLEDSNG